MISAFWLVYNAQQAPFEFLENFVNDCFFFAAEGGFGEQTPHEDGLIGSGNLMRFKNAAGNFLNIRISMLHLCGSHTLISLPSSVRFLSS